MKRGGAILAGGLSRRMGRDKALIPLREKPALLYVAEALSGLVEELVVVISKRQDALSYRGILPSFVMVLQDELELQTPLVGMLTAFKWMKAEYVALVSCDLPFLNQRVMEYLFSLAEGRSAVIPRWRDGKAEPLHAIYARREGLGVVEECLRLGELSFQELISRLSSVRYVSIEELRSIDPELRSFFNMNDMEDYRRASALLGAKDG